MNDAPVNDGAAPGLDCGRVLTIDRGNSNIDCMLHDPAGAGWRQRLDPARLSLLRDLLQRAMPERAIGASVVAGGLDAAAAMLGELGLALPLAGSELPCPLRIDYPQPARLGVDRWLGALAAWRRFGPAVVVDCGTALTVNLVGLRDGEGTHMGGAIAPGCATMAAGLRARAPGLPEARAGTVVLPARDPEAAVATGVTLAFCGAVERLVADLAQAAGLAGAPIVVTGGEAELYLRHGRLRTHHVPDLVHQGLLWLLRVKA